MSADQNKKDVPIDLIDIKINKDQNRVNGLLVDGEIYFPVSFINKYYEAYGEIKNGQYHFSHHNGLLREITDYHCVGNYINFEYMEVESWDNYFDGESIPVNNFRWGQYYYPISILHYGMSHYCQYLKNSIEEEMVRDIGLMYWSHYNGIDNLSYIDDKLVFRGLDNAYLLALGSTDRYVNLELSFISADSRIYLEVETTKGIKQIQLNFGSSSRALNDNEYYVGIPKDLSLNERITIFRDLETDVKKMFEANFIKLKSVKLRGDLDLYGISTSKSNHKRIIQRVADWLLKHQDDKGAWASYFDHMFYKGRTAVMKSGWYSAMAQGLAISYLVRAYHLLKVDDYLIAARNALKIYSVPVSEGGVLDFYDSQPIFEEYPTTPASHVLNGFMFALFGLYDLKEYENNKCAEKLYGEGFKTLEKVLPLYDMGNRSAYDLTHITAQSFPNIARWSYHITHVHQLKALSLMNDSQIINSFYDRWNKYSFGFKVKTN